MLVKTDGSLAALFICYNILTIQWAFESGSDLMLPMLDTSENFQSALPVSSSHTPLGSLTMSVTAPSTGTDRVTFWSAVVLQCVSRVTMCHECGMMCYTNLDMECWLYL